MSVSSRSRDRAGEDFAAGPDDDRVALLDPGALLRHVARRHQPVAVGKVIRDLVDVEDRVDADHEHPVLPRQVPHRRDPGVARGQRRREPHVDPLRVQVEPRQRHVVLPADQPADPPERRFDDAQRGAVAHAPDGPLRASGHELAMLVGELAIGGQVQEGVVDRAAVRLPLLDADHEPHAVLARDRSEAVGGRPGN